MLYRSFFPRDVLSELGRLQRELQQNLETSPSIRGVSRSGFPAINIGSTPKSVEIYAFVPGISPSSIDVQLEKGVLTITSSANLFPFSKTIQAMLGFRAGKACILGL